MVRVIPNPRELINPGARASQVRLLNVSGERLDR